MALDQNDLTRTAGSLGEPFRVIESLPGVTQVAWPLSLYAIRGANPGNTGFFLDGVRLPALFHFALGPAVIHPHFLERMEFYPGGYPAQYGRFVSGVVAASTAAPKPDRVRGSADVRLFDAGGIIATPFNEGRGTVAVAGRYSYTGLLFSMLSPDYTLALLGLSGPDRPRAGAGPATLFTFGSSDVLGNKSFAETNAEIRFHRLDLRWQGKVGPGRLLVGNAVGHRPVGGFARPGGPAAHPHQDHRASPPASPTCVSGERLDWEIGGDAESQWLRPRSTARTPNARICSADRLALAAGAYTARDLATDAGHPDRARRPLRRVLRGRRPQDRAGAAGLPALSGPAARPGSRPRSGVSRRWPACPVAVPGFESFGLGTLGTQTSKQGSFGIEQGLADALSLDVTGFYQRLLLTDLLSVFNYDPADPRLLELRDGESYGVEVMLRRSQSRSFFGWLAYTLSYSQRLVGPSRAKAWSDWDQRHVLNLVTGIRFRRRLQPGNPVPPQHRPALSGVRRRQPRPARLHPAAGLLSARYPGRQTLRVRKVRPRRVRRGGQHDADPPGVRHQADHGAGGREGVQDRAAFGRRARRVVACGSVAPRERPAFAYAAHQRARNDASEQTHDPRRAAVNPSKALDFGGRLGLYARQPHGLPLTVSA